MKVLAVLANDKKKSLNRYLFENIIQHLSLQNYTVDVLDLYQHQNDIPFYVQPKAEASITNQSLSSYPFFQEHQARIMAADVLVIVTPIYWYTVPGILKSWLDLITGFAWKYTGKKHAQPLHHIKKVVLVSTMGMPWFYKVFFLRNAVARHLREIFNFMGIKNCIIYEITSVYKLSQHAAQKHLQKILQHL